MVNKIVGWLVLVPLCAVLIAFALANRHLVAVNLNPFAAPADASAAGYGIPLFVILYVVLLIGVCWAARRAGSPKARIAAANGTGAARPSI